MIKNIRRLLLLFFVLTLTWTCLMIFFQRYANDGDPGIFLLLIYTTGFIVFLSLMSAATYILLIKPLSILRSNLRSKYRSELELARESASSSRLLIAQSHASGQRILTVNEILETNIAQLTSEIIEVRAKNERDRQYQREIAHLCQLHLQTFTGYLNLFSTWAVSESLSVEMNSNQRFAFYEERIFDAAAHLGFLIGQLPDQDFDKSHRGKEGYIDFRQCIDETIACIEPSLPGSNAKGWKSSTVEVTPLTDRDCPDLIVSRPQVLKSLLFHFIKHCLMHRPIDDDNDDDDGGILELRTSFNQEENKLVISSNYFLSVSSHSMKKLNEICSDSDAEIYNRKLYIPANQVKNYSFATTGLKGKNILAIDTSKQWCEGIVSRLRNPGPETSSARSLSEVKSHSLQRCELIIVRRINSALLSQDTPLLVISDDQASESFHQIHPPLTDQKLKSKLETIFSREKRKNLTKPVAAGKGEEKPLFDLEISLSAANHDPDIAAEMLQILIKTLPEDLNKISTALQRQDWNQVKKEVHRLSGAIRFCGVPQLQDCIDKFSKAARSADYEPARSLFKILNRRANELQSWYKSEPNPFSLVTKSKLRD